MIFRTCAFIGLLVTFYGMFFLVDLSAKLLPLWAYLPTVTLCILGGIWLIMILGYLAFGDHI